MFMNLSFCKILQKIFKKSDFIDLYKEPIENWRRICTFKFRKRFDCTDHDLENHVYINNLKILLL